MSRSLHLVGEYRPTMDLEVLHSWAVDVIKELEAHSDRVTELLRYNSQQVVQRRLANAKYEIALEALQAIANGQVDNPRHSNCLCSRCAMTPGQLRSVAELALIEVNKLKAEDFGRP